MVGIPQLSFTVLHGLRNGLILLLFIIIISNLLVQFHIAHHIRKENYNDFVVPNP